MSTTAEDVSGAVNEQSSSLGQNDEIAALLIGDETPELEDESTDESQSAESTLDEDDESNDESEADDDSGEEEIAAAADDEDATWESVLGVSEDKLNFDDKGNVVGFVAKVNGEETVVPIQEAIANYQTNKAITTKGQAFAEERKAFEAVKEQVGQEYTQKLEAVDALSKHFEQQLISEYDGVDWDNLRVTNPAEYAAARHDFSAKASELQRIQDAIATDKAKQNEESLKAKAIANQAYAKQQYETMIEKNPEWSDKDVLKKARASFQTFVDETYGFTEQEFNTVFDARLIELIKDAKKYHEGTAVAAKKLTKPVPKFQKSGGKPVKAKVSKLDKLTKAAREAKGGAKRDLQATAVAELLMGSK